ncbi:hypothetical protein [Hydrogenimonas sp. SS33]|uniref:hypothetical protein n=1 Tax=Hydrogenimonas leucolamina TaxID=2954236 RepID=UPI00336BC85B
MCLILTIVFIVLAVQAAMTGEWAFTALYGTIALFFVWLLQRNVRTVLAMKGRCGPSGCSFFDLFKRPEKQIDDAKLRDEQ